jgi:hypothetical protein
MNELITLTDPRSPASEAYRTLRTNLSFYSLDEPIRTLVVTSPTPNDGKSVTIANLAMTMAQSGRRTILVDCDLRRPSLHSLFGVNNDAGLTTMILDETATSSLQPTSVENLSFLTSGLLPPNPADLLGSRHVERVLENLLEKRISSCSTRRRYSASPTPPCWGARRRRPARSTRRQDTSASTPSAPKSSSSAPTCASSAPPSPTPRRIAPSAITTTK